MPTLARDDWPNARLVALREAIGNGAHADDAMPEARWRRKVERMVRAEFGGSESDVQLATTDRADAASVDAD